MAVLIAAFLVVLSLLVYVLLMSDNDAAGSLSISSDDPLAIADYEPGTAPRIGLDHWHAAYFILIGDEFQPNAPTWQSGVHTHDDGIIHIHPFIHEEQGSGAALNKWFEYGGGELTETSMRVPGMSEEMTMHVGDPVPGDGRPGEIYVILNGVSFDNDGLILDPFELVDQWVRVPIDYIPHDGDVIRIMFQSEEVMREHIKNPPNLPSETPRCEETPREDNRLYCDATPPVSGTAPP
jgi:hypothetical protein